MFVWREIGTAKESVHNHSLIIERPRTEPRLERPFMRRIAARYHAGTRARGVGVTLNAPHSALRVALCCRTAIFSSRGILGCVQERVVADGRLRDAHAGVMLRLPGVHRLQIRWDIHRLVVRARGLLLLLRLVARRELGAQIPSQAPH